MEPEEANQCGDASPKLYHTRRQRVAQTLRFAGMTAVEVLGSVDELTDWTVRSIDAATVAGVGPNRKSRFN
jgi:hypothetical protein